MTDAIVRVTVAGAGAWHAVRQCLARDVIPRLARPMSSSGVVKPVSVVLKPNWIESPGMDQSGRARPVVTDPMLIRTCIESVRSALSGADTVVVCDAPHTYADFAALAATIGRGGDVTRAGEGPHEVAQVLDLRREVWVVVNGVVATRTPNPPDPCGYVRIDLGERSALAGHSGTGRYYGADYDRDEVNRHHSSGRHEYLLAGTPMRAGLFINLPKLKTHKKTGITASLKNLVGINGDKNWLPHHTAGSPDVGGDEYPAGTVRARVERLAKSLGQRLALASPTLGGWLYGKARGAGLRVLGDSEHVIRNGNWHGNDTTWRMALDLNRAFLYGRPDGTIDPARRRQYLTIIDGIIGGEGNGPLSPEPVESNVLIISEDPAAADAVACKIMGFDPMKIPIVREAFAPHPLPIATCKMDEITVDDERVGKVISLAEVQPSPARGYKPHFGWMEHLRPDWPK